MTDFTKLTADELRQRCYSGEGFLAADELSRRAKAADAAHWKKLVDIYRYVAREALGAAQVPNANAFQCMGVTFTADQKASAEMVRKAMECITHAFSAVTTMRPKIDGLRIDGTEAKKEHL